MKVGPENFLQSMNETGEVLEESFKSFSVWLQMYTNVFFTYGT